MIELHPVLRKNAMSLLNISENEIIRTAGIVQKVKNFFSKLVNPEHRRKVLELENDTVATQEVIEKLNQALDDLREAIASGNLEEYKVRTKIVQELSLALLHELKVVNQETQEVKKILRTTYTLEEMENEDFLPTFKSSLPEGYDVELNTFLRQPLKNFSWYKNLSPSDIGINVGEKTALSVFLKKIAEVLKRGGYGEEEITILLSHEKIPELLFNFKSAIINGEIIQARPKKPSKKIPHAQFGQTSISVTTSPFSLPDSNILLQGEVGLVDLRSSLSSRNKLSLQYISNFVLLGNPKHSVSEQLLDLKKEALSSQHRPATATVLNELQLAKALRLGYEKVFGSSPSLEVLGFGWAQVVLEAGRPIQLRGNNIGNIKATDEWVKLGKPYTVMSTQELDKDGRAYIHEGAKWKAFDSPEDGAAEYWSFLNRRFPNALRWASSDINSAVVTLGAGSYFTANIKKYSSGVQKLYQEFITKIAPQLDLQSRPLPPPGQKPIVKDYGGQYSKEEKEQIRAIPQEPISQPEMKETEVDSLMHSLLASQPVTNLVKTALLRSVLPKTKISARILSEKQTNKEEKIKFASGVEKLWQKFLGAETKLNTNNLILEAQIHGSNLAVLQSAQAISDSFSDSLEILYPKKQKIYSVVLGAG